jgi:hypothetical protein
MLSMKTFSYPEGPTKNSDDVCEACWLAGAHLFRRALRYRDILKLQVFSDLLQVQKMVAKHVQKLLHRARRSHLGDEDTSDSVTAKLGCVTVSCYLAGSLPDVGRVTASCCLAVSIKPGSNQRSSSMQ